MPKEAKCSVARCAMFSSNALIMMGGNALIIIGIFIHIILYNKDTFTNMIIRLLPMSFIVIGLMISILSIFSSCATSKSHSCTLTTCCIIIAWILICQIILGIVISEKKNMIYKTIKTNMNDSLEFYIQRKDIKREWDELNLSRNCCGVDNYTDWNFLFKEFRLPGSCCYEETSFYCNIKSGNKIFTDGCYKKLMTELQYGIYLCELINLISGLFELENVVYGIYYVRAYVIKTKRTDDSLSSSSSTL